MAQDKKDMNYAVPILLPYIEKIIKIFNSIELYSKSKHQEFDILWYKIYNKLTVTRKDDIYSFTIEYSPFDNAYKIVTFMKINSLTYVNNYKYKISPKNIKYVYSIILLDIAMISSCLYVLNHICIEAKNE